MNVKKLSLLTKLIFSAIPMIVASVFSAYSIYQTAAKPNSEGARALGMVHDVTQAELEMVKMSEALRGYLLNPTNTDEFRKKKEADQAYGAYSESLSKWVTDSPEITELNHKMAEYDATDLDRIENEIADMIAKKDDRALKFYEDTYLPARKIQNENFGKLKSLVQAKSESIFQQIYEQNVNAAVRSVLLLLGSVFGGLGIILLISSTAIRKLKFTVSSLEESSQSLNQTSHQISLVSENLSQSSTEQAASIQETSSSIEEISSMVAKTSENSRNTTTSANRSQENATLGKQSVQKMIQAVREISQSNQAIMDQIQRGNGELNRIIQVIEEIGTKTKVINDIVFQTKLLSFNASVEAARAGEHGKGFSVVAEEVGNLAQMSGNASKEITELLDASIKKVHEIVADTNARASTLSEVAKSKVEIGAQLTGECGEILDQIVESVTQVTRMSDEISSANQEQTQGIQEITRAIGQLDQVTQKNAATSQEVSQTAELLTHQSVVIKQAVTEILLTIQGHQPNSPSVENNVVPLNTRPILKQAG